jgi:hypothetical protein
MRTFLRLPLALLIALGAITGVHAQSKDTRTVLPVWNKGSGKVEALLYLEPTGEQAAGARWHFGRNSLDGLWPVLRRFAGPALQQQQRHQHQRSGQPLHAGQPRRRG